MHPQPPQKDLDEQYREVNDKDLDGYSQLSTQRFFIKHSYRDVCRHKCHFCLSFCSVFMVVWSALIINTIVERGPIIFLKLAETLSGQYDGMLYPSQQDSGNMDEDEDGGGFENVNGVFLDFNRVMS